MALDQTTLAADLSATGLSLVVTSATGAAVGKKVRVNNEMIGAIIEVIGTTIKVRGRGDAGTLAVAHKNSSNLTFGDPEDFSTPVPAGTQQIPQERDQAFYVADGAIALPVGLRDVTAVITKGSAAAMTLADPSKNQDGVQLTLIGGTDFAHVVTASIHEGTTGGAHTTLTSAAFAGSTLVLQALKGKWYQKSNALWVLT